MFKKITVASLVLAASSTVAFAGLENGTPYVGADIGVNHQIYDVSADGLKSDLGATTGIFGVSGGYGALVNPRVYLGAEVLLNASAGKVDAVSIDTDEISGSVKFKTKYTYGLSIIPGYMLTNDTMLYARAGVVNSLFNVKAEAFGLEDSNDKRATGGQFGLGLKTKLTQKVDLRGEYSYTNYKSFKVDDVKVNPSSGQATVGLVYNLG